MFMKRSLITFVALAAAAFLGNAAFAQTTTYYLDNDDPTVNGWTYSDGFHASIKLDFTNFTQSKNLKIDANYGCHTMKADTSNYRSFIYNAPVYDPNTGADLGFTWPIKFYMCGFAPSADTWAQELIDNFTDPVGTAGATGTQGDGMYPNDYSILKGHPSKGFAEIYPYHGNRIDSVKGTALDSAYTKMGFIEIDNIPHVDAIQWSFSCDGWRRGVKMDKNINDGNGWAEQRWCPSDQRKTNTIFYTGFSQQGYLYTEALGNDNLSVRWRIWNGDMQTLDWDNLDEITGQPKLKFGNDGAGSAYDYYGQIKRAEQIARIHDIQIYSNKAFTAAEAAAATAAAVVPNNGIYGEKLDAQKGPYVNSANAINDVSKESGFNVFVDGDNLTTTSAAAIVIYNVSGEQVDSYKSAQNISLETLPSGMYIIKATGAKGTKTVKIAIK